MMRAFPALRPVLRSALRPGLLPALRPGLIAALLLSLPAALYCPHALAQAGGEAAASRQALLNSAPGTSLAESPLLQQFQKLEDDWSLAVAHKDQFALENLLSPTFIDISAAGAVNTRNQRITEVLGNLPEPVLSMEQKVVTVRVVSDIAVVEGTYIFRLKQEGHTRDERGIFTHVYQRARNNWTCVNAQRTAVVDQIETGKNRTARAEVPPSTVQNQAAAAQAPAAKVDKKSSAILPFHVPLFYKGPESKNPPAAASTAPQQP